MACPDSNCRADRSRDCTSMAEDRMDSIQPTAVVVVATVAAEVVVVAASKAT